MKKTCTPFDTRQEMQTTDFEIFHSFNNKPIIVDYHHHDFCEILIFISGNVSYIVEGKTYYLRPGDIMMTNNKEIHRPVVNEGQSYERYVVWVHQNFFDRFLKSQNHPIDLSLCFDSSSKRHYNLLRPSPELLKKLTQLLESLIISPDDDGFGADILREIHMCEFLILLNRAYFLTGPLEVDVDVVYDDKISDIIYYINQNLCEDLNLDDLAERFFISKFHLIRQFKTYAGLSPKQYIIKKRLFAVKEYLLQGTNAMEAATACGFNDYSHFFRSFKNEFGLTPKDYMQTNRT